MKDVIKRDFRHWKDVYWPYFPRGDLRNLYYDHVNVKMLRPWFSGSHYTRRTFILITRLRMGNIAVTDHLLRFEREKIIYCDCGFGDKSLRHLLSDCPLFRNSRARFSQVLSEVESYTIDPA